MLHDMKATEIERVENGEGWGGGMREWKKEECYRWAKEKET